MNPATKFRQKNISEYMLIDIIEKLLMRPQQPSAEEFVKVCTQNLGEKIKEEIKGAVLQILKSDGLPTYKKEYLSHMIEDRSLDKAIAGNKDFKNRKEVITGIDNLLHESSLYRQSENFREMINFMAKFKEYSPYNNMLVRIQNPSCHFYATVADWENRFDRKIKEDAKPMLILAPMHPVMLVYDVDQTEGDNKLPDSLNNFGKFYGHWHDKWLENIIKNINRYKIRVNYKKLSSTLAGFATYASRDRQWKMRIAIHDDLDNPSRFGVLCHELAHIFLGHLGGDEDLWWPSRINLDYHSMEIEAEATAFIVTQQLGLEGSSSAYVSGHLRYGEILPEGVSLDYIAKVSGKIGQMTKKILPAPKARKGNIDKQR